MRRLSPVKPLAIGLTLLFLLLCGGVFLQRNTGEELWQVTISRKEQAQPGADVQEKEMWPVSLLPEERINLNTAPVKDLARLPQIGEKRATDIAAWREEHGLFLVPEDLMKVSGIGEGIFAQIEEYITVKDVE